MRLLNVHGAILVLLSVVFSAGAAPSPPAELVEAFRDPPIDCRPHTRWWWFGNAIRKEDISWQLEQMRAHGIGGVEQITMGEVYEKGNHDYLSPGYMELITHAVYEAKRLGMEVSLNFGGPGWVIGGDWVPPEDRSKNLLASSLVLGGGQTFRGDLPIDAQLNPRDIPRSLRRIRPEDRVVAVIAGKIVDGRLVRSSLVDLTALVEDRRIVWEVPEGQWRLMVFWLAYTGQENALDHFNKAAMERYCDHLGGAFKAAFGAEFGKTVESFFCDSFEVEIFRNGIYWSEGLLDEFRRCKGYDLTPLLPAIWWEVDDISPKVRYDVNEFLHYIGLEAFFKPFLSWCEANGVKGRIQPYGFTTDILEGAGMTHLPEMEITAGEKDAVPWFDTRIGPKKYVASGAHLYGRNIITVEAYTYLHWEPYRETLEELKITTDIFLRSGANKFYNQGYSASPERDIAPTRSFYSSVHISHDNIWWKYYPLLADYVARCSYLFRQGHFAPDVAIYSPLANQWTIDALNARRWTRDFDWGELGKLLIANGYDFDLINDDILQNHARFENGEICVQDMRYKFLILPNIQALPLASLERIETYAREGGVVIALERVPEATTGLDDYAAQDARVREITGPMFIEPRRRTYGKGHAYFLQTVIDRSNVLDRKSAVFDPFVNTLRKHLKPDFGIDFVREGIRENEGLTFYHRQDKERDIYFVANVQDRAVNTPIEFRVSDATPWRWDPYTGGVERLHEFEPGDGVTRLPIRLAPYDSTIIVFEKGLPGRYVAHSDFEQIEEENGAALTAVARANGRYGWRLSGEAETHWLDVTDVPPPLRAQGVWRLTLEGRDFPKRELTLTELIDWTAREDTRHFSGTGRYELTFTLPPEYLAEDIRLLLDPGVVGNVAEVTLNGHACGVTWLRGQTLDVTGAAKPGENSLVVDVTNTLINRIAGMKELPSVPGELRPLFGGGVEEDHHPAQNLRGFAPLPRSGLLGPVRIVAEKRIRITAE